MPLDTIYITRHGHRLGWTIDLSTGTYHPTFPTPTGIPNDPRLTTYGIRQSHELAAHLSSDALVPKPCRVYSSPFYRCLETIGPSVEALRRKEGEELVVRAENGIGEWFGRTTYFSHPSPASQDVLTSHFPSLFNTHSSSSHTPNYASSYKPHLIPPVTGESITELHDRLALTLDRIIAEVDAELLREEGEEENGSRSSRSSKAILICTHAAPLIAAGRALTGDMPEDSSVEDFRPFTAGLSTFVRRRGGGREGFSYTSSAGDARNHIPDWRGGKGVGGGWDCVGNGECGFLSGGEERGWHFNGEESFDTTMSMLGESGAADAGAGAGVDTGPKL